PGARRDRPRTAVVRAARPPRRQRPGPTRLPARGRGVPQLPHGRTAPLRLGLHHGPPVPLRRLRGRAAGAPAPQRVGAACRGRYEGRSRGALPPASQRPLVPASDPRHRPVARPYVGGAGAPVTGAPRPPRPRALRPRARRPRPRPRSGRARLCRLRAAPAGLRGGRRANRWPARAAPTLPGTGLGPPGSRRGTQGPAGGDAGGRARRPRGRGVVTRGAQNLAGAASAGESVDLVASVMLALRGVADPEIPVLDVVEMGIVRDVRLQP